MLVNGHDVDAAIFDFDGTLADSMWVWDDVDRAFFERRGLPFDETATETISVLGFEGGADFVIEHYGIDEDPDAIIQEWKDGAFEGYSTRVKLKPGAMEYLKRCKECGLPVAIATSLQRHLLEACLRNNGALELFDALCICEELQCGGKSTPAVYLEAARRLGVDVRRCAVFEDIVTAAASAKEAGAYVVGVYDEHKQQATERLKSVADRFVYSWDELLEEGEGDPA